MAGMGAYSRKRTFTPEGPEAFTKGIAQLLGLQNKSLQQVGESVDDYGKSKATGKLAELMGSEGFGAMTPEQAQAASMEATGGRTMNERGETMMKNLLSNKQSVLDNTNKEAAAKTLFGRQEALAKTKQKYAKDLIDYENGGVKPSEKITPEQFAKNKLAIESYRAIENDKNRPQADRDEAKRRRTEMEFEHNQNVARTKMDSQTKHGMSYGGAGGQKTKLNKLGTQTNYPNANSRQNTFLNSKLARELGVTRRKDKHGNFTYIDKNGQLINDDYLDKLNNNQP